MWRVAVSMTVVGLPKGPFGYIFVKTQHAENTARRSRNQKTTNPETQRDGAATKTRIKTLKRRGSSGSRGLLGVLPRTQHSSRRRRKGLGPTLQPPKTSASSATSAFQGSAVKNRL